MFKAALLFVTGVFAANNTTNNTNNNTGNNTNNTNTNNTVTAANTTYPAYLAGLTVANYNSSKLSVSGLITLLGGVDKLVAVCKSAPASFCDNVCAAMLAAQMNYTVNIVGMKCTATSATRRLAASSGRRLAASSLEMKYVAQPAADTNDASAIINSLSTVKDNVASLMAKANDAVATIKATDTAYANLAYVQMSTTDYALVTATVVDPVAIVVQTTTSATTVTAAAAGTTAGTTAASATSVSASAGIFAAAAAYLLA